MHPPAGEPDGRKRTFATRAERRRAESARRREDGPPIGLGGATFSLALLLTAVGTLIPGVAFIAAGRRRLGIGLVAGSVLVLAVLVWLATGGQRTALHLAVDPGALLLLGVLLPLVALAWALIVIGGYGVVRPMRTSPLQRGIGAGVVSLLCLAVVLPTVVASRYAFVQRDLISTVFAVQGKSATVPTGVTTTDPWAGQARVNLLLLGGDGGPGREGVRTDTVIVASVDTATGDTALLSLPRNLENLPFPPGPLRTVYPKGFKAPGNEGEQLLNAIYRNVTIDHPDILKNTDNLGADVLKLGVGEALGINVDYYMLINLEGFKQLADALGGITVNINDWVPIGGVTDLGIRPDNYLHPGPDQHLNGFQALWFARGRYGSSDYARMDRQRCVINAVIAQANPVTLLSRYQALAATTKDILQTDIPQTLLPAFVDLALRIKDGRTTSVVFDNTVINPAYPDYNLIRATVKQALAPPPLPPAGPSTSSAPTSPSTAPPTTTAPSTTPPPVDSGVPPAAQALASSCAYDPAAAEAALKQGEPPTRGG